MMRQYSIIVDTNPIDLPGNLCPLYQFPEHENYFTDPITLILVQPPPTQSPAQTPFLHWLTLLFGFGIFRTRSPTTLWNK